MALGTPIFYGGSSSNSPSTVNVSCTPTLGQTIYVFVAAHRNSSTAAPLPTISDTDGHTWTTLLNQAATTGTPRIRGVVFQAVGKGNATTITVTPAVGVVSADVVGFPGADTDYTNSNVTFGAAGGGASAAISAVSGGNGSFVSSHYFSLGSPSTVVAPSTGFTNLANYAVGSVAVHVLDYALTSPPNTASYTSPNGTTVAFMFEVKASAGAPDQPIAGALFSNDNTFYGATVTLGPAPQAISGALFTNANAFFAAVVSQTGPDQAISGALFTDPNTFFSATVSAEVPARQPGGGYRKHRPIIYVDAKGNPVDLTTYKARTADEAMQAAKASEPKSSKALAKALSSQNNERIAEQAHRLALATADAKLSELLLIPEQLAIREAEEDEEAAIMLLLA